MQTIGAAFGAKKMFVGNESLTLGIWVSWVPLLLFLASQFLFQFVSITPQNNHVSCVHIAPTSVAATSYWYPIQKLLCVAWTSSSVTGTIVQFAKHSSRHWLYWNLKLGLERSVPLPKRIGRIGISASRLLQKLVKKAPRSAHELVQQYWLSAGATGQILETARFFRWHQRTCNLQHA